MNIENFIQVGSDALKQSHRRTLACTQYNIMEKLRMMSSLILSGRSLPG